MPFVVTDVDRMLHRDKAERLIVVWAEQISGPVAFRDLHFGVSDRHRFYPTARPDPRKGLQHVCGVPGMLFLCRLPGVVASGWLRVHDVSPGRLEALVG